MKKQFRQKQGLLFVDRIPFDPDAVKAINNEKTIVDIDCASGTAVKAVYNKIMELLFEEGGELR